MRDIRFDYLRSIGLVLILICHFCIHLQGRIALGIHDVLSHTGNYIFFMISGWLLGIKWRENGCPVYGCNWLVHCAKRIYIPLWSFLIPYFIWLIARSVPVGLKDVLLNMCGLSWLSKMYGIGHLWYVTMTLMFYGLVLFLSRWGKLFERRRRLIVISSIFAAIMGQYAFYCVGVKQTYLFSFLWIGMLLFFFGNEVLHWIMSAGRKRLVLVINAVVAALACLVLWEIGYTTNYVLRYWIALIASVVIVFFVMPWLKRDASNRIITWIAGISFDVYLVHSIFREEWVRDICANDCVWFFVYIIGSFVVAVSLRYVRRMTVGRWL